MAYGSLMSTHNLGGAFDSAVIHVTSSVHTITNVYAKKDGIVYTGISTGTNAFDIKVNDKGTYEIWASVDGASASKVDSVTVSQPKEYNVDVLVVSKTLNDNSWDVIQSVSAKGNGSSYWSVGALKLIELKEWGSTITSNNKNMYVYILGFKHNQRANDKSYNTITFCMGYLSDKYYCLTDDYYAYSKSGLYYMSDSPKYYQATLYYGQMWHILQNNLLDYFPSDLRRCLVRFDMVIRTTNNEAYSSYSTLITLPSEFEIFGKNFYGANEGQYDYIKQYAFFASGNERARFGGNNGRYSTRRYWTRTCGDGTNNYFVSVDEDGKAQLSSYSTNLGVTPIFCV